MSGVLLTNRTASSLSLTALFSKLRLRQENPYSLNEKNPSRDSHEENGHPNTTVSPSYSLVGYRSGGGSFLEGLGAELACARKASKED